jgi:hypothetical protein
MKSTLVFMDALPEIFDERKQPHAIIQSLRDAVIAMDPVTITVGGHATRAFVTSWSQQVGAGFSTWSFEVVFEALR